MLLTLAVVLPTPHGYSGTFQGGYSARFTASRMVLREQEGFCALQEQLREELAHISNNLCNRPQLGSNYVPDFIEPLCVEHIRMLTV